MGWSIDIVKLEIDTIFNKHGIKCEVQYPDAMSPRVYVNYDADSDIPITTMRIIADKFPETVHVFFRRSHIPDKPILEEQSGNS